MIMQSSGQLFPPPRLTQIKENNAGIGQIVTVGQTLSRHSARVT